MDNQKNNKKVKTEQTVSKSKYEKQRKKISLAGKENREQPPRWNSGGGSEPRYTLCGSSTLPALSTFHFFVFFCRKLFQCFFLLLKLKLGHKLRPYISISLVEACYRLYLLEWLFWFLASLCYIFFVQQLCFFPHTVWLHQASALLPHDISIKHNPGKASGKQVFCG